MKANGFIDYRKRVFWKFYIHQRLFFSIDKYTEEETKQSFYRWRGTSHSSIPLADAIRNNSKDYIFDSIVFWDIALGYCRELFPSLTIPAHKKDQEQIFFGDIAKTIFFTSFMKMNLPEYELDESRMLKYETETVEDK